jgi:hypothetical protein
MDNIDEALDIILSRYSRLELNEGGPFRILKAMLALTGYTCLLYSRKSLLPGHCHPETTTQCSHSWSCRLNFAFGFRTTSILYRSPPTVNSPGSDRFMDQEFPGRPVSTFRQSSTLDPISMTRSHPAYPRRPCLQADV